MKKEKVKAGAAFILTYLTAIIVVTIIYFTCIHPNLEVNPSFRAFLIFGIYGVTLFGHYQWFKTTKWYKTIK